jgi:UDP:flavonoid glycosyltransferase YjiC (YdhE family)
MTPIVLIIGLFVVLFLTSKTETTNPTDPYVEPDSGTYYPPEPAPNPPPPPPAKQYNEQFMYERTMREAEVRAQAEAIREANAWRYNIQSTPPHDITETPPPEPQSETFEEDKRVRVRS